MPFPFQTPPPPPPAHHRHHLTRYYAHRFRESLTSRIVKRICSVFLMLLFVTTILTFILWLSLRPHRPRFHVTSFSVSDLTQSSGIQNSDITFDVSARNPNRHIGIYYDNSIVASLFYRNQQIGLTPPLLPPFYQSEKNTTMVHGVFSGSSLTAGDELWAEFAAEVAGGKVAFRLVLAVTIRFRVSMWDTHRHRMHAECEVEVGPDGAILAQSRDRRCNLYFF